jgi:hypothetical protein
MKLLIVALLLAAQTSTSIFRFEADGFWLNLHHFLYVLGRAQAGMPDIKRRAVASAPFHQADGLKGLNDAERRAWQEAVTFYATGLSKQDMVFSRPLIDVTNAMRVPAATSVKALQVKPDLMAALEKAAPIYRRLWWPSQEQANHARVREYARLLEQHGDKVLDYITRKYEVEWPKDGFPVNISGYANWAGAYSTAGNLIVVSSLDEGTAGSLGLESIFHEAMHQWDEQIQARLSRLSKEHQTAPPREGITHALIWYTAAEAVKSVIPGHVGYAESGGMWKQKQMGSFKAGLDAHWKPYLDGRGTLDAALVGLLKS